MSRALMYLSILQTGMTYVAGFATAKYFINQESLWGYAAIGSTLFLLMSSKYEGFKRIEALLGPAPEENHPIASPKPKEKSGTVGFSLPGIK